MSIEYRDDRLVAGGVPLEEIAAAVGTPVYVYDTDSILERLDRIRRSFDGLDPGIRYAVKANSNGALLSLLAREGAGFDLVSGGELLRALAAGGRPADMVFAGVGKQDWELELGLEAGIGLFVVESEAELDRLAFLASRAGRRVDVALRLNPDVGAATHDYIATGRKEDKFGLNPDRAENCLRVISSGTSLRLHAFHVHLGSLILDSEPYLEALRRVLDWCDLKACKKLGLECYDLGGGFGIRGPFAEPMDLDPLGEGLRRILGPAGLRLLCEPGRYLLGDAGLLLVRALEWKPGHGKDFLIVDGGMNDLIRPALYGATHEIVPLRSPEGGVPRRVDVVGPVCESGDFLGRDRSLPESEPGTLYAVLGAGAYGFSMSSDYNSRPRPAEVLVSNGTARLIRRREDPRDLWRNEGDEGLDLRKPAGDPPWREILEDLRNREAGT